MDKDELIARLRRYEWNDVEFKQAQRGVPDTAYETVSAFSNTAGGWLVFGVKDTRGDVLRWLALLKWIRSKMIFLAVCGPHDNSAARLMREKKLLSMRTEHYWYFTSQKCIARDKPVYLNGDIRRAYIRRGGGDERCTPEEIERFLRDASDRRYDSELIEGLDAEDFFDPHTVSWYRRVFNEMNPGRHEALTDVEFLNEWGCVVESGDRLIPTRGAVLLFGQGKYVRQILPRAVVDYD